MWKYFTKVDNGGTCKLCNLFVKTCGNTTNLKQHLKRKHPSLDTSNVKSSKSAKTATTTNEVEDDEDDAFFVQSVVIFLIIRIFQLQCHMIIFLRL